MSRIVLLFIILFSIGIVFNEAITNDLVTEVAIEDDDYNQNETAIAIHPEGDTLLVATWNSKDPDEDGWDIGFGFSTDGGCTWDTGVIDEVSED